MPFASLEAHVPEVVPSEIRSVHVVEHGAIKRTYTFLELFCDEKGCDCRRVMLRVVSDDSRVHQPRATLSWGWEPDAFYRKWAGFPLSPENLEELRGPALVRLAPQSEESSAMLAHLRTLLADEGYVQRVIRHYRLFRERVEQAPASEVDTPRPNRAQRRAEQARQRARR